MSAMASQTISVSIVCSTVCSGWLKKTPKLRVTGLCEGIHRWPVYSPHKGPVTRKMISFDDVIISGSKIDTIFWLNIVNHGISFINLGGVEFGIYRASQINILTTDAVALCGARSSIAMTLTTCDKSAPFFHGVRFQLSLSFQCWEMKENASTFLGFPKINSARHP